MASYRSRTSRKLGASARAAGERAAERAQRLPWAPDVLAALDRERLSGAALLAGGLAYRLFFWLVSFGLVVSAVAGFWVRADRGGVVDAAKSFGLSGVAAHSAASAANDESYARWYLLVLGAVLLAYFGIGAVRALRVAAFVAWQLKPTRLRRPLRASAAFTAVVLVEVAATGAASWVRHDNAALGVVTTTATSLVYFGLALLAFKLLPHAEATGRWSVLPGAALVGCCGVAIHLVTAYYLSARLEHSPKLYGVLGAATVVLLGLFFVGRVIVAGMFLNATLHRSRSGAQEAGSPPTETSSRL